MEGIAQDTRKKKEEFFAIVQWEDRFANIINMENITSPKKQLNEYHEGEYVTAYFGKKVYKARLSEISSKWLVSLPQTLGVRWAFIYLFLRFATFWTGLVFKKVV